MRSFNEFLRRIGMLLRGRQFDREMEEEIRLHRELRERDARAAGADPEEARYAAQRHLGNELLLREHSREAWGWNWLEHFLQDVFYGARLLRKNPGFTVVAVLTLALGIGANTAIFQLLNAALLRPLPVENPDELVVVRNVVRRPRTGNFDGRWPEMTYPIWERVRDRQEGFSAMGAWFAGRLNLAASGEARFLNNALWVSGDFFHVLGVRPILGRVITAADDQPQCGSPGTVISYAFWQREFGGDVSVVGRKLLLNGHPFEIIGVTPANFFGVEVGRQFDVAIPVCADALLMPEQRRLERKDGWWLSAIARLKPGWTAERATAQLTAISPALYEETLHPGYGPEDAKNYRELRLGAVPAANGVSGLRSDYSTPLWLLLAATGVVLLIACANLANLLLARASARGREFAMRLALGASRSRLVRQLLAESLLLATLGALVGAWLASVLSQSIVALLSTSQSQRYLQFAFDWRMLAFTAGLTLLTCVLCGVGPALRATQLAPAAAMNVSSRGTTAGRESFGLRRALIVSQIALSLVLLQGAMLFSRTLQNLMTLDAGFRQDGILQVDVRFAVPAERRIALSEELQERLRAIPGVDGVASSNYVPLGGSSWNDTVLVDSPSGERKGVVNFDRVSPGYFRTLEIAFLGGRDFDERDNAGSPAVVIVNESFARKFFDGANPVGQTFKVQGEAGALPQYQIVGLVKDTKYGDLREEFGPIGFFPARQAPVFGLTDSMLIRSALPVENLTAAVKSTIERTDPNLSFKTMVFKAQIRESLRSERLMAGLSGFFGVLAALVAAVGLYGVISFMVTRRRNEIAIRMALGAHPGAVARMILGEASILLAIGLSIGVALAVVAARAADSLLYGLRPHDPGAALLAMGALAAVALIASYVPARRAARLDPMIALRDE